MVEPRGDGDRPEALGAFLRSINAAGYELRRVGPASAPHAWPDLFDELVTNEPLRTTSSSLFRDEYYARAVEEAFKFLNNAVRDKSGEEQRDGAELMRRAFSVDNPALKLNNLQTPSEQNEQRGYMDIFAGAMTGIRNPRAHDHQLTDEPEAALEMIMLANHLLRKLDVARVSP